MKLRDKIKALIAEQFGMTVDQVADDVDIVDGLGADSLDCLELVMALEEEFGKPIPDEDADRLRTLPQVEQYVRENLGVDEEN